MSFWVILRKVVLLQNKVGACTVRTSPSRVTALPSLAVKFKQLKCLFQNVQKQGHKYTALPTDVKVPPTVKRQGGEVDHSPPPSSEVNNEWSRASAPPIRLHGVERGNFILVLVYPTTLNDRPMPRFY